MTMKHYVTKLIPFYIDIHTSVIIFYWGVKYSITMFWGLLRIFVRRDCSCCTLRYVISWESIRAESCLRHIDIIRELGIPNDTNYQLLKKKFDTLEAYYQSYLNHIFHHYPVFPLPEIIAHKQLSTVRYSKGILSKLQLRFRKYIFIYIRMIWKELDPMREHFHLND